MINTTRIRKAMKAAGIQARPATLSQQISNES